jgi:hypothetical protein
MTNNDDIGLEIDEFNLEDLIVLGEDTKIPITITFPKGDGTKIKAKALVKQLTLKELDSFKFNSNDALRTNTQLLTKALFKQNGENFTSKELEVLPIGVVNALTEKIMELSGMDNPLSDKIRDF